MVMMMTVMVPVVPMMLVTNRDDPCRGGRRRSLRLAGMGSVLREQRRKIQHYQEQNQKQFFHIPV